MPWWLLGFSLVSTTFAADTPNLVTDIVRNNGVAGNWVWWAFLLTGMTTVFIYARLWRRIGVMTDIEFYEVRYSGRSGAFLRGFRTLYIGLVINTLIMAAVTLAIIKIMGVMTNMPPHWTIVIACGITVLFTMCGGFTAVLWVDFVLFMVAMSGAVLAALFVLRMPEINGLSHLLSHPNVVGKLSFFPNFNDTKSVLTLLVVPLAVQWWSAWYPGAEPGGGSYTAQRMLAAKNESHAVGATLFFNFCHYAVRPWPWILVALASLIVFPDIASLQKQFPALPNSMIKDDIAYPAMLTLLPHGLFGFMLASLFAAYMSTVATHLNLGSSYMVNDFHRRFWRPQASEQELVLAGRIWTVVLMIFAAIISIYLKSALDAFDLLIMVGAGTGLLFLLRWFWWRINAYSEISAMIFALLFAIYFRSYHNGVMTFMFSEETLQTHQWLIADATKLVLSVALTTLGWILVTLLTPPTDEQTLREFIRRSRANGPGWKRIIEKAAAEGNPIEGSDAKWSVPFGILCSVIGCISVYACLMSVGLLLYGNFTLGFILLGVSAIGGVMLIGAVKKER